MGDFDVAGLVLFGGQFGLDEALEVGEGLLGVDKEGERLDVFSVRVLIEGCEGDDQFEEAGWGRQ